MGFPFNYELGDSELRVLLGSFAVRKIAYSDMADVSEGLALFNEHWTNFWPWRFVTIRRKTGLIKNFVVNPAEREPFMADIKVRIAAARSS